MAVSDLLTLAQVAREMGVGYGTVLRWADVGAYGAKLPTTPLGSNRVTTREDLAEFLNAKNSKSDGRAARHRKTEAGAE